MFVTFCHEWIAKGFLYLRVISFSSVPHSTTIAFNFVLHRYITKRRRCLSTTKCFLFFSTSYTVHSVHGSCILEEDSFEYLFLALHLMLIESYEKDRQTYRFNSGGRRGNFSRAHFQLSRHFFIHLKYLRQAFVT